MKAINKGQEGGEISRNPDPHQAAIEEMEEILEEDRGGRKLSWQVGQENGYQHETSYDSRKAIKNFGKKGSEGGHFWHPKNRRGYSNKGGTD